MIFTISKLKIVCEEDIVYSRQRARFIAKLLGLHGILQTKISTVTSEVVRFAIQYALGGETLFQLEKRGSLQIFSIVMRCKGIERDSREDILDGPMGKGIREVFQLMDSYKIKGSPKEETTIYLSMNIPTRVPEITPQRVQEIRGVLEETTKDSSVEEIRLQNRELLEALEELQKKQEELLDLNQELEDTNRGVIALYEELDEKAQEMYRTNETKTKLLSYISHEIRTPINSILSISSILLDGYDGDLNEEQQKQVSFIRESTLSLSTMVSDLLEMGQIEIGKTKIHPRESTVEDLFSSLRGMLRPIYRDKEPLLIFEEPTDSLPLYTDDRIISQILRNFITNAYQFTEEGEIRVKAKLSQDGQEVIFSVSDTGRGIPLKDQETIFEEYRQLEIDTLSHEKGMGLGLTIAQMLAKRLGGTLGVESRINEGSTFYAYLPLYYDEKKD